MLCRGLKGPGTRALRAKRAEPAVIRGCIAAMVLYAAPGRFAAGAYAGDFQAPEGRKASTHTTSNKKKIIANSWEMLANSWEMPAMS